MFRSLPNPSAKFKSAVSGVAGAVALFAGCAALSAAQVAGPPHARYFERAFSPDFIATADDALPGERPRPVKIYFQVSELGAVQITSGRIVVADAFVGLDQPAMSTPVPVGSFPVRLAVLHGGFGKGRVAFARVDFSDTPVVRWEPAVPSDMARDAENPDGVWGFAVDTGTAAFFDPAAGAVAAQTFQTDDKALESALEQGQLRGLRERGATGAFRLSAPFGPGNLVAFDSGWGDGTYTAYFGFDAQGHVTALIADFDILDWSKVVE